MVQHLNSPAAAKVTTALVRLEQGNFSNAKSVGAGVHECRIDFARLWVYFGRDGAALVILIGGGVKKRQNRDIQTALNHWKDYKRRKEG